MSLTLKEALDTSAALAERLFATPNDSLAQKKAMVDCSTFGLFKQAGIGSALGAFGKPLAWGVGLGLPALGVGHLLATDARRQGEDLVNHARNQALLTALGVGGMQGIGSALQSVLSPKQREETHSLSLPDDQNWLSQNVVKLSEYPLLQKLAAVVLLDNVLEQQVKKLAGEERDDAIECFLINRSQGVDLLRELLR